VGILIPNDLQACGSGCLTSCIPILEVRLNNTSLGTYPLRKARETYLPRGKRPLAKKTVIRSQKKEEYSNPGPL
jgi:hypothetical protein